MMGSSFYHPNKIGSYDKVFKNIGLLAKNYDINQIMINLWLQNLKLQQSSNSKNAVISNCDW